MIDELIGLSAKEQELLLKAPIITCLLIAGADDHIDNKEIKHSLEMARNKHKKFNSDLMKKFYLSVAEDFEDKLKIVLQSYPTDPSKRNEIISGELAALNSIWPKLPDQFAQALYTSLKDIAKIIAESSGGLLGINSVDEDEARLVNLPMIHNPGKK